MAPGTKRKLQISAALLAAAAVTCAAFAYGPIPGVFTGGCLALGLSALYDRQDRKPWQNSVSSQLKHLNEEQARLSASMNAARTEISSLKKHITETAVNIRSAPATAATRPATPAPPPAMAKRAAVIDHDADYSMPRAVRPSMLSGSRSYEDLIIGQNAVSDSAVRTIVNDAVKSQRVDVFIQPIVRLPQRKVRFYEMYARVRAKPGLYLSAARYIRIAEQFMMMRDIDRLLLTECLDLVRETAQLERAAPFFININPASLKNGAYMNKLLAFVGRNPELAPRLIFEMTQKEFKALKKPVAEIIRSLGKIGCSFSIDNVNTFDFDAAQLNALKIRYIKIPAPDISRRAANVKEMAEIQKFKRRLETNGISVIAERIENERMMRDLLDFDIQYGQGYLFGKPDMQSAYRDKSRAAVR